MKLPNPSLRLAGATLLALLLAACSGIRTIAADVNSFGDWPADRKPGSYAFDRLPSQQVNAAASQSVEVSAAAALAKAGFSVVGAGQQPEYLVQVGASDDRYVVSPWDDPVWWRGGFGYGHHGPWGGPHWGMGMGWRYDTLPRYERQVGLLIRDRASGRPLFEARSSSGSVSPASPAVVTALFEAALAGFPKADANPHRVIVQMPQ